LYFILPLITGGLRFIAPTTFLDVDEANTIFFIACDANLFAERNQ
jgi:hypothetical protein